MPDPAREIRRAYEELFRILSDTQADLARAAEATALAETAAVAAQQRNQQVTVRVLPSPPLWPKPEISTSRLPVGLPWLWQRWSWIPTGREAVMIT
eukprot:s2179_g2.t1